MSDIFPFIDSLKNNWQKKRGIIGVSLFFSITYLTVLYPIVPNILPQLPIINLFVLPITLIIILILFWFISTRRIGWIKRKQLILGLLVKIDDEKYEIKINKIVEKIVKEINHDNRYEKLQIRLYPTNHLESKGSLTDFLNKKEHVLDCLVFVEVGTGNIRDEINTEEKISVEEITFCGNFSAKDNLRIFKTSINIEKEVQIRNINKNWSYLESNSYVDKKKLAYNLKDSLLFFSGIYSVYQNNFETALEILKTLHDPISSKFKREGKKIIGNDRFLGASRLNEILLNLFSLNASRAYMFDNNKEKAYRALKECESIFKNHPQSFGHYISLARFTYEMDNLSEAKRYTSLAKALRPSATEVFLNQGYFAILDNDIQELHKNYKELAHTYRHKTNLNYIDIIAFLDREKNNNKESAVLFEFAIGFINYLYGDKIDGRKILFKVRNLIKEKNEYLSIYALILHITTKGPYKSNYTNRIQKKKRRKRS